jgi:hypothetical protein
MVRTINSGDTSAMTAKWHGGKGSQPRKNANNVAYQQNWEKIFGDKSPKQPSTQTAQKELPPKL